MSDRPQAPFLLMASQDPQTGDIFFPARTFAADGSLRRCLPIEIEAAGILYSWTRFGRRCFGQIDLAGGPRVQATLLGESHDIGARYVFASEDAGEGKARKGYARG